MPSAKDLLNESQQEQIVKAIEQAEKETSGEIRIHIEDSTAKDPLERAKEVFVKLGMHNTKDSTGVLIYAAVKDHKLAIVGDKGIHAVVGDDFWEKQKDTLIEHFSQRNYTEGLVKIIGMIGEQLKQSFPHRQDDKNELPDDVSFQ